MSGLERKRILVIAVNDIENGEHVEHVETKERGVVMNLRKTKTGNFYEVFLVPKGGLKDFRSTQVKKIKIKGEELRSVPRSLKSMSKKELLQARVDGMFETILSRPNGSCTLIGNQFKDLNGELRRQIVVTSDTTVKCNLGCGRCIKQYDLVKFKSTVKEHTGAFLSSQRNAECKEHLRHLRVAMGDLRDDGRHTPRDLVQKSLPLPKARTQPVQKKNCSVITESKYWKFVLEEDNDETTKEDIVTGPRPKRSVERFNPTPTAMFVRRSNYVPGHKTENIVTPIKRKRLISTQQQKEITNNCEQTKFCHFSALKYLHKDLAPGRIGVRAFPRDRQIMPIFMLENAHGKIVDNRSHEAFEQFVVCWMFQDFVARTILHESEPGEATPTTLIRRQMENISEPHHNAELLFSSETVVPKRASYEWWRSHRLRILELGGGIGAVSTMIQQNLASLDPEARHVVFEPNTELANGPLMRNKDRFCSNFEICNAVLSDQSTIQLREGSICSNHPRAWMWGTIQDDGSTIKNTVPGYSLKQVEEILGGKPNILVADCEGGLPPVIDAYPEILDHLFCIYYERDFGDYSHTEQLLQDKGFFCALKTQMHRVWVRNEVSKENIIIPDGGLGGTQKLQANKDQMQNTDCICANNAAQRAKLENKVIALENIRSELEALSARIQEEDPLIAKSIRFHPLGLTQTTLINTQAAARRIAQTPLLTDNQRLLVKGTRVLCPFTLEFDNNEDTDQTTIGGDEDLYLGLVAQAPDSVENEQKEGYHIIFDDGDERTNVPRSEIHAIYIRGTFEFSSVFLQENELVEQELPAQKRTKSTFKSSGHNGEYAQYLKSLETNQNCTNTLKELEHIQISSAFFEQENALVQKVVQLQKSFDPTVAALAKPLVRKWRAAISAARRDT
uniref:Uncharacterized protein n=1 Tax=Aureoumbra lagunensis TaxID=44058 RepID=A0A7S3JR89_9STRA|mmetsp:Transcript_1441/g.2094  ORF Transcript_1441/g.2094 Transcript_1441/m.2094 type:complete len:904 (+) Transcript_1441:71-2782(+)